MTYRPLPKQKGATLIIALIILLVVTVLAISNMREVTLESRITGNVVEQSRLLNVAEAGLREGERRFFNTISPPEPGTGCSDSNATRPCVLHLDNLSVSRSAIHEDPKKALTGKTETSANRIWMHYRGTDPDNISKIDTDRSVVWHTFPIPAGEQNNEAENPEYGNMMRGIGTFYYETNSKAENKTGNQTILQAAHARLYTN